MSQDLKPLILDLVEWVAGKPRPYTEVIEAWRTTCPRLTVWEDAVDAGFVGYECRDDGNLWVVATPLGREVLSRRCAAIRTRIARRSG